MSLLNKLQLIFDRSTKIKLVILLIGIIFGAFLEMLALSMVAPFISVLIDYTIIESTPYLNWTYDFFGFTNVGAFLAFLVFLLSVVYIFRGIYLYALNKIQFRFIANRQNMLSARLLRKLLGFSYLYHANKNLADLQRVVVRDVENLFNLLISALILVTDLAVSIFLVIFMLIVSPGMTLMLVFLACMCVVLYLKAFRTKVRAAGDQSRASQVDMVKTVNQALGGIKEVKVLQREDFFFDAFMSSGNIFVAAFTKYRSLNAAPRLVIESICFGGAFAILGFFILSGADISALIPQLSLVVLSAFRLLPAVSRQLSHATTIIYNRASIDAVYKSLFEENDISVPTLSQEIVKSVAGSDIEVIACSFQYPGVNTHVLMDVSLAIPTMKSVAFVGPSGAGKTTLADLILGILTPDSGYVLYNGEPIHHNFNKWCSNVGYIPQQIYLLDESILANVAFGVYTNDIDEEKVWRALEQAQLAEFVKTLPDGLYTVVGDRGIRLSGGQRQRVGIARALYEDPSILILDEATSSLDDDTERAVMEAVLGFQGNKTMIIIAHRLSTIQHCDIIYRVENKMVIRER